VAVEAGSPAKGKKKTEKPPSPRAGRHQSRPFKGERKKKKGSYQKKKKRKMGERERPWTGIATVKLSERAGWEGGFGGGFILN